MKRRPKPDLSDATRIALEQLRQFLILAAKRSRLRKAMAGKYA